MTFPSIPLWPTLVLICIWARCCDFADWFRTHIAIAGLTAILNAIASVATAAALFFLAWQVSEARQQNRLSSYQAQSDNIAKKSELVKYLQSVLSQSFKLQQWKSLTSVCVESATQGKNCRSVELHLIEYCKTGLGRNELCAVGGIEKWVTRLALEQVALSTADRDLRDVVSSFLQADIIGVTEKTDKTSLAGEMGAAVDGCAYYAGRSTAANLEAHREVQAGIKVAEIVDQLRVASQEFLSKVVEGERSNTTAKEIGYAIRTISVSLKKLRKMRGDQVESGGDTIGLGNDVEALAWAIGRIAPVLEREIEACDRLATDSVKGVETLASIRDKLQSR